MFGGLFAGNIFAQRFYKDAKGQSPEKMGEKEKIAIWFGLKHLATNHKTSITCSVIILIISCLAFYLISYLLKFIPDNLSDYFLLLLIGVFIINNFLWEKTILYFLKKIENNE